MEIDDTGDRAAFAQQRTVQDSSSFEWSDALPALRICDEPTTASATFDPSRATPVPIIAPESRTLRRQPVPQYRQPGQAEPTEAEIAPFDFRQLGLEAKGGDAAAHSHSHSHSHSQFGTMSEASSRGASPENEQEDDDRQHQEEDEDHEEPDSGDEAKDTDSIASDDSEDTADTENSLLRSLREHTEIIFANRRKIAPQLLQKLQRSLQTILARIQEMPSCAVCGTAAADLNYATQHAALMHSDCRGEER
jgi:hypothetical protein